MPIKTHAVWKGPPFETKQRGAANGLTLTFWLTAVCQLARKLPRREMTDDFPRKSQKVANGADRAFETRVGKN